jgi:D-xylose 1-dehydrogenase (NADP+, D-xylono-1,5-lactone-forming)
LIGFVLRCNTISNTAQKIRWGILGCARIAKRGLIPGIAASKSGVLHALASRDEAVSRLWAEEYGFSKAYGSYRDLLADAEIDAVYIPLPNELHKPWALAAADAGKHILCEKPLALDAREADAMAEACRKRGVILMEAFMWRHQPRTLAILQTLRQGELGELRLIRSSFSFPIAPGDWRLDPSRGGGALWDVGCYGVNAARLFTAEEPSRFRTLARRGPSGVDLSLTAILEFPSGVLALVDCSFEQPFRCCYELVGTRGMIEVPLAYLPPTGSKPAATISKIDGGASADSRPQESTVLKFKRADQYAAMVDLFASSVSAGTLLEPGEDGLAQMLALERVNSAARA